MRPVIVRGYLRVWRALKEAERGAGPLSVRFIDYEYAGMNHVGFDIANHWCGLALSFLSWRTLWVDRGQGQQGRDPALMTGHLLYIPLLQDKFQGKWFKGLQV